MCCFSRPVQSVTNTKIFARSSVGTRQYVVYSMRLDAREDLAMILPLPTDRSAGESACRFINLEKYTAFFADVEAAFPQSAALSRSGGGFGGGKGALEVHSVGSYDACFVPKELDFGRLDARFRLPQATWNALPQYANYGFAVFKLKPGATEVHPMAFDFYRADPKRHFFPTVHIHDGQVHATAMFDHSLYCQKLETDGFSVMQWMESAKPMKDTVKLDQAVGIVAGDLHGYKLELRGRKRNQDVWL